MKNVLLLVHSDAGQEARLQAALDLVRALDGHLMCLDVIQMPVIVGEFYGATGEAMLLADERSREDANRTTLEARLAREDVPWNWIEATGEIADCVTRAAGMADLIVLNRKLDEAAAPDMREITGRIAIKSRKPIVAVREEVQGFNAAGNALIAWDGSEPVMATMKACVPLLKLASAVRLFTVQDGSEGVSAQEAAAYLSRHDIHPDIASVKDGSRVADELIMEHCSAWRADYCLMGAYSRSRVTEALFGGVTRRMLSLSRLPLVLGR